MALRSLDWPGCDNARDLGGLPTADGSRTLSGALVRSDSPHDLTDTGVAAVDRYGVSRYIAAGIAAVADAPPGAVLVHCAAGKDRTGMTVALLLRFADVTDEAIAADYAYTAVSLAGQFRAQLDAALDEAARQRMRKHQECEPETILEMLRSVDERYGSVHDYLCACGLGEQQLRRLRNRLRTPDTQQLLR